MFGMPGVPPPPLGAPPPLPGPVGPPPEDLPSETKAPPPEGQRAGDWTCPKCGINVFAKKDECFKCHSKRDGSKGDGKGKEKGKEPPPDKFSEELYEQPRKDMGLKLIGEETLPEKVKWDYIVNDDNRRSYAAFLACPFTEEKTKEFFDKAKEGTDWKQPEGPLGPIPRKTAWMVAPGCDCTYRYGSIEVEHQVYPPWMVELMKTVMPYFGMSDEEQKDGFPTAWPTCCNMNLYEDGAMSVGWHTDDERLFQGKFQDIRILSLSLGVKRTFELRINNPEVREKALLRAPLGNGDLMTMEGMMQKHYNHRVPKEEVVEGPRINLTWRWVMKHGPKCPVGRTRPPALQPLQEYKFKRAPPPGPSDSDSKMPGSSPETDKDAKGWVDYSKSDGEWVDFSKSSSGGSWPDWSDNKDGKAVGSNSLADAALAPAMTKSAGLAQNAAVAGSFAKAGGLLVPSMPPPPSQGLLVPTAPAQSKAMSKASLSEVASDLQARGILPDNLQTFAVNPRDVATSKFAMKPPQPEARSTNDNQER